MRDEANSGTASDANTIDSKSQRQGSALAETNSWTSGITIPKLYKSRRQDSVPAEFSSEANSPMNTILSPPRRRKVRATSVETYSETMPSMSATHRSSRQPAKKPAGLISGATPDANTIPVQPQHQEATPGDSLHSREATQQLCLRLAELQKVRIFCIVSQSRIDRSMESALARCLGYDSNSEETDRKAVFKAAGDVRRAVEAGKECPVWFLSDDPRHHMLSMFVPLIPISAQSREVWDANRLNVEKEMRKLAVTLPICEWVKTHAKGVGELGLARLIGEAPLIGVYATHQRLWKRMGLAVIGEERQQRKGNAEEALIHGYAPRRRAEVWSVCSDTMFRQQWRGAGGDPEAVGAPIGAYGEVYRSRKEYTVQKIAETEALTFSDKRKWTKKRCDSDARRIMSKEFLRDLWRVWHGMDALHPALWAEKKIAA